MPYGLYYRKPAPRGQRWNPGSTIRFVLLFALGASAAQLRAGTVEPDAGRSAAPRADSIAAFDRGLGAYLEGTMLQMDGRHAEAIAAFRRSIGSDTTQAAPFVAMARSYLELGRPDSALFLLNAVLRQRDATPEAHRLAGLAWSRLGKGKEAIAALERALELEPEDPATRMNLLGLCDALRLHEKALALIESAPEDLRAMSPMRVRRARLLLLLGRNAPALEELVRVARVERDFPEAEALLLLALSKSPPVVETTAPVESLLAVRPGLHRVRVGLARILLAGERWPEAEPHLARLLREQPDDPAVLRTSGMYLLRAGRIEEAEDRFRQVLAISPDDPDAYRWLCRAASMRGQPGEALAVAGRLLARSPGDREGILCEAFALSALGRRSEAVAALEPLRREDPGDREAGMLMAALLVDEERFSEATGVLQELHRSDPSDREVAFQLGSSWERAGQIDSAAAVFDRLLARDPDDALVLNYTGYMCIDRGIRLTESMARVRRAMEIDPENGAYVDSYGWGLFRLGRTQEAEAQLRRAISLAPREPEIHRHLGEVLESQNRLEEARDSYRRAQDLRPEDPVTRRLLEALEARRAGQPRP